MLIVTTLYLLLLYNHSRLYKEFIQRVLEKEREYEFKVFSKQVVCCLILKCSGTSCIYSDFSFFKRFIVTSCNDNTDAYDYCTCAIKTDI